MREVHIVGAARTPIGRFMGGLASVPAPQLGAVAIRAAVERAGVDPQSIGEVVMGNVISAGLGQAPARQAGLAAGLPEGASALTVNKVCASGLEAVNLAALKIAAGETEVAVAGGMENMSAGPHLLRGSRAGFRLGNAELIDATVYDGLWCAFEQHHMGNSAEAIAEKYGLSRRELDECALRSHQKAVAAMQTGRFKAETVPVEARSGRQSVVIEADEAPRPDTSLEALAKLKPAFVAQGCVTAGNAPGITDGAAALVLASAEAVRRQGLAPLAKITGYATAAVQPRWLFDAPSLAVRRLLERTGTRLEDYDLLEVNEAFAAQIVANGKVLGWDWERVNVNGGAIALGHPIGATGARLVVTLIHALHERGLKRGLAALCHGGGGAVAMSFEVE
ncbi:MAG: acetyl-CoA C-acetyltransferase [Chloroflexi bacterium]|nr:acetyl-CoA C-acetyltransferase [Chloroflexota bacterium]